MNRIAILFVLFICAAHISAQELPIRDQYINGFWDAYWITHPSANPNDYGVYHFRKAFELAEKPGEFVIHVSADNRYKLYVNGEEAGIGPARGDLQHWRFETIDIAKYLNEGKNVLAAVVWNFGQYAPVAQISQQTAFIAQGNGPSESVINTDKTWKVIQNEAYAPETESRRRLKTYIVVGPGDIVTGARYPWGWEQVDYSDDSWDQSRPLSLGQGFGRGTDGNWLLVPRQIPAMKKFQMRLQKVRRSVGIEAPKEFLTGTKHLLIPPRSKVSVLLDQTYLTTGYPELVLSKGKGARVKISYSEALFDKYNQKGNRNEIEGKEMRGYVDIILPDGAENRAYRPLWNRTWRYIQLDIETSDEALIIEDIKAEFTGYPFEEKARFSSDRPWLDDAWKAGWRTAGLCAGETYFDCPYYEQLQYVGDSRIQALISLYVSGDDRLMRRAINDFDQSRLWNGLTQSRYPSSKLQIIPPYSLFWIAMIHDHWMHIGDEAYVQPLLPGIQSVLGWYEKQLNRDGLLGTMKWWHFTDWADEWPWNEKDRIGGVPMTDENGNSSVLALQYAYALQYGADIYRAMGDEKKASFYDAIRKKTLAAVNKLCWDESKGCYSDLPGSKVFSQHANILAILTDAVPENRQQALMKKILSDESLIQATFYFRFYLFRALVKTGMADQYIDQLAAWKEMLDLGLSTFAEKPDPTRSDCHAWSASPNYDLLAIVAGIMPASPGFKSVRIAPALCNLRYVEATMPHPNGEITVVLNKKGRKLSVKIKLPEGLEGVFVWEGNERAIGSGVNEFIL